MLQALAFALLAVHESSAVAPAPTPAEYRRLADELDSYLARHVLAPRFPRCVDREHGGFHVNFAPDWSPQPDTQRFVVYEARVTWTAATVALLRPAMAEEHKGYVRHGVKYLSEAFWDREHGGFHTYVRPDGSIVEPDVKITYGNAFAVYALAAAYQATGDQGALDLARRGFEWMESKMRVGSAYLAGVASDGSRLPFDPDAVAPARDAMGWPSAWLSMNTHIHVLEAYAELLRVWPDPRLRERTRSVLAFVRDQLFVEPGTLHLFLTPAGRPVTGPSSYGHDFESGFLLHETEEALHESDPRTARAARMLVDHSLAFGWNPETGQVWNEGFALGPAHDRSVQWWMQYETANVLLLMHERYGSETPRYFDAFVKTWRFLVEHLTDEKNGGTYQGLDEHGKLLPAKSHNWFASYHQARSLLLTADRLRRLSERASSPLR